MLGPKAAEKVMTERSYDKGMRVHKITLQALWRIRLTKLLDCIADKNADLKTELLEKTQNSITEDLMTTLASGEFEIVREDFLKVHDNPNLSFGGDTCR